MYQPPHFHEDSPANQHALIRAFPLGLLITHGPSGIVANPIPFMIDPEADREGVVAGLQAIPDGEAHAMASLVDERLHPTKGSNV